jgi:hypothetical protein
MMGMFSLHASPTWRLHYEPRTKRRYRIMFNALGLGMSLAFFAAFAHHAYRLDFKPMAALGLPILVVFFGFASLFFIAAARLAKGARSSDPFLPPSARCRPPCGTSPGSCSAPCSMHC